jgi:N-acetylglucosaminyldiphosphoundecaprenol N-acetyl-beta-D-mannosaminyltransferase
MGLPFGIGSVNTFTRGELLNDLEHRLQNGLGFATATVNLDHVAKLRRDPGFRAAYERHTHIVADGNPVVWLNRLAGRRVSLVTGSDLVEPLMELAARLEVPVAFLGSTPNALDVAARRLAVRFPSLRIVAQIAPSAGFEVNGRAAEQCLEQLQAAGPKLCLVALGAPKQEMFVARALDRLQQCGFVSVGAGLDFIAGTQRRAPVWCRKLAMEWLWRLASDPSRLTKRYIACIQIIPGLIFAALRHRLEGGRSGEHPRVIEKERS